MSDIADIVNIKQDDIDATTDGISLLALKNHSLMAYLHNLVLVLAAQLSMAKTSNEEEIEKLEKLRQSAIERTVVQRVVLEKGVKGLEAKIAYQIEKVLRAYNRAKEMEERSSAEQPAKADAALSDDSDDEDVLAHRPRPSALSKSSKLAPGSRAGLSHAQSDSEDDQSNRKYKAPKISATSQFGKEKRPERQRKNAVMEEYLKHSAEAPIAEPSIGTNIMDQGRGGLRTARDERMSREQTQYEEENYKRLPGASQKQSKREAKQRSRDAQGKNFFGEDWGFDNDIDVAKATKKKRKEGGAWGKVKRRKAL